MDFEDGLLASVETNCCTLPGLEFGSEIEIHGSLGSMFIRNCDQDLKVYTEKEAYHNLSGWFQKTFPRISLAQDPEVSYFVDSIIHKREPPCIGEQ